VMRSAILIPLVAALLAATGCSGSEEVLAAGEPFDVSGVYRSTETIGELGFVWMEIVMVRPNLTFKAVVSSAIELGEFSQGVGTVGGDHLILNFDRGKTTDYYYEGMFETNGNQVARIDGRFIFPDLAEDLPVEFEPVEL